MSSEAKKDVGFTPGPWHRNIKPATKYPVIFAGRNTHIAKVDTVGKSEEEVEANLQLIQIAPDLFDALLMMYQRWEDGVSCNETDGSGEFGASLGRAFHLSDEEEKSIIKLLSTTP